MKRVAVIGAGVSGLSCAHRLQELRKERSLDLEISVFEASARSGGNIQTEHRDGFLLEKGPDSFITERPAVLDLCRRLDIEKHLLPTNDKNRRVFIVHHGRLVPLPEGFYLIAPTTIGPMLRTPLFSLPGKIRMAAEWFIPPAHMEEDESIASFIRRRFGREVLERVGQPMIAGIHSGDPEMLSANAVMPQFKEMERRHGSVIRGLIRRMGQKNMRKTVSGPRYGLFLSFRQGMATLTDSLAARLPENSLYLNSRVSIKKAASGQWIVTDAGGHDRIFDAVCLAVSAREVMGTLKDVDPALSDLLGAIRFESVATLNLAYKKEQVAHPLDSFGLVAPAIEKGSFMACTFSSQKFEGRAEAGSVLLRAFIGGAFGKRFFGMEDADLVECVTRDLGSLLGVRGAPSFYSLARYRNSLPQYALNHAALVTKIEGLLSKHPGLHLTGSSYRGTGISHAVQDGQSQAESILESFSKIPSG